MNDPFIKRCFRLERSAIAYLRFILEGYDGLIFLRTLDPQAAVVEVAYPPACRRDAETLLAALARECNMTEMLPSAAEHYPPL